MRGKISKRLSTEQLERREMFAANILDYGGLAVVLGTPGSDAVVVREEGETVVVEAADSLGNISSRTFNRQSIRGVAFSGGEGSDLFVNRTSVSAVVYGDGGDDVLFGGSAADALYGGLGNDTLLSGDGDDRLYGQAGHDLIAGGNGNDLLDGGSEHDWLYGQAGDDEITGGLGNDQAFGGEGHDRLFGNYGDDILWGEGGNDMLHGSEGNDILHGAAGNDVLIGWSGNDLLAGGDANDELYGDSGHDILLGNAGNDLLQAGAGADILVGGYGFDSWNDGSDDDFVAYDNYDLVGHQYGISRITIGSGYNTLRYNATVNDFMRAAAIQGVYANTEQQQAIAAAMASSTSDYTDSINRDLARQLNPEMLGVAPRSVTTSTFQNVVSYYPIALPQEASHLAPWKENPQMQKAAESVMPGLWRELRGLSGT